MERAALMSHSLAGLALLGLITSWLILLSGVSAVQKSCPGRCRVLTGLPWWIIWFQLFALLVLAAVQFVGSLAHGRTAALTLLAVLAALEMFEADQFLNYRDDDTDSLISHRRYNTAVAGFALLAAFNLLSILLLGLRPPRATPSHNDNVQASNSNTTTYSNPVAKSTAGPGETANMRPFHTARSQSGLNGNQTGVPPPPAV